MRTKVVSFFIFPRAFGQKIKKLAPKMTKIASRRSCLNLRNFFLSESLSKIKCFGIFLEQSYHFKMPKKVSVMAARRGLLALLSSTSKDYEEVLAYVRSQRMSSKLLRRIVDELGIKHEDDLDEELSVPDLCELLTGHGKRGQSDHPAELSIPRDTNGQNSEPEPEGENPGTPSCMTPRDEKMITSLLSTITRLVSITNDLKTELHGLD